MLGHRALAALGLFAMAGGCRTEVDLTIYLRDITDSITQGAEVTAPAVLSIEVPTLDSCNEHVGSLGATLIRYFGEAQTLGCTERGSSAFAEFSLSPPIRQPGQFDVPAPVPITVGWTDMGGGTFQIGLLIQEVLYEQMLADLPNDIAMYAPDRPEVQFRVTVHNDLRDDATIETIGSFVNGFPYQLPREWALAHRDQIVITVSDVGNAAALEGGTLLFNLMTTE